MRHETKIKFMACRQLTALLCNLQLSDKCHFKNVVIVKDKITHSDLPWVEDTWCRPDSCI